MPDVISIPERASALEEPFKLIDLARVNEAIVRLARLEGEFPMHSHLEDEMFLCWSGRFTIELEGEADVDMAAGSLYVVPAGRRHRPVANRGPAYVVMLERPETKQHGND